MTKANKGPKEGHSFVIHGNVIELRNAKPREGPKATVLYKRMFVSPEFVQLFYKLHDGQFDENLYNILSDVEKQLLASSLNYLNIDNKEFNIALSKNMRKYYDQYKLIEAEIAAGNLSKELHDRFSSLVDILADIGALPKATASYQKKRMARTCKLV